MLGMGAEEPCAPRALIVLDHNRIQVWNIEFLIKLV